MSIRNPMTDWMLPPEQEPGEFEQRWNVAPDRRMPMAGMFARGGMPGMESYGEADPAAVFGAYDKAKREDERRAKILGSLMPGQTREAADRPSPHSGTRDRAMMELGRDLLVPQTPLDAGLMIAGGPVGGKLLRGGAAALGALFEPDAAEAAPKPRDPRFWHGISVNKLTKPMSEMFAETTPTQTVRERFISPEALEGGVLLPAPGDRAMAGEKLIGVGGKRLDVPVELQGGHGFMSANPEQGHVWASDKGVISTMGGRVKRLADQYANVYVPYTAMGERSVDFSHHVSDTLAEMVKDAKILKRSKDEDKATAATFDAMMNEQWGKDFKPVENWPGIHDPNLREYLVGAPGRVRNKFAKLMDTTEYQAGGFPNVAEARLAVTDPRLLYDPSGAAGLSIAKVDPRRIEPSAHRTYSTAIGGDYVGGFGQSIPREVMYPDIVKAYREAGYRSDQYDYLFGKGTAPFFQPTNAEWLEGVMRYMGRQK